MSFNVKVRHYVSSFPLPYYWFARLFLPLVKSFFQTDFIPTARISSPTSHVLDGVDVKIIPLPKILPHAHFSNHTIAREVQRVYTDCFNINFVPDVIVGHFANPQLELIPELSRFFPAAKTSIVFHEPIEALVDLIGPRADTILPSFSKIGFRFPSMMSSFLRQYRVTDKLFVCPSGIPDEFILPSIPKLKFLNKQLRFCYAGMLIPLKNVDVLIRALYRTFPLKDFTLDIIGEGIEKRKLVKLVNSLGLDNCVRFVGKISRTSLQEYLAHVDIFVMVSAPEAFGLVYLEAMSKGCITIGSINQGIDGVIVHGFNGFLCRPGDVLGLSDLFSSLSSMTYDQRRTIGENALLTVRKYTNKLVAEQYLSSIFS